MSASSISTLADLIAQCESSGNQFAYRYEVNFVPSSKRVTSMMAIVKCNMPSANILCKSSFGLFQIMGDNLIKLGMIVSPFEYCNDPVMQLDFFNRYCQISLCEYTLEEIMTDGIKRLDFAKKYNGPGEPEIYAQYLLDEAYKLGVI